MTGHDHRDGKPCYRCIENLEREVGILPPGPSGLVAAGGWCAPSGVLFDALGGDALARPEALTLPAMQALRGGIDFTDRRTPAERAAADAWVAHVNRVADRHSRARRAAIDAACAVALAEGWDVHVYEPPTPYDLRRADERGLLYLRSVGIEFTPAEHPIPTIHHHPTPEDWRYLYDGEDD